MADRVMPVWTDEQRAAARKELEKMVAERSARQEFLDRCKCDLMDVLKRYYPNRDARYLDAPEVLAHLLHFFDCEGEMPVDRLYLRWMASEYAKTDFEKTLPMVDDVIAWLLEANHTRWDQYDGAHDLNAYMLLVDPNKQVFVIEGQSWGFLYIREIDERFLGDGWGALLGNGLRICQFWPLWTDRVKEDPDYCAEEEAELRKKVNEGGVQFWAEEMASPFQTKYSDWNPDRKGYNDEGVRTPERPHLQWFIDRKFCDLGYGDSRDGYHVYRHGGLGVRDQDVLYSTPRIGLTLFYVNCLHTALEASRGD